ncbi:MAG: metallophosphoesterase family protein [Myxococcota bacterium]
MKIAAISDLHIGACPRMDSFRHRRDDFLRFLDDLESRHDHIVLLGDIYQCDHGWSVGTTEQQLAGARAQTPWLTARLDQANYTLVQGNHDRITGDVLGAPDEVVFDGAFPVLLTHGDQFDPIVGGAPLISYAASWMTGRLRWGGMRPLAAWLEGRDVAIKAQRLQTPEGPYAMGAQNLLTRRAVKTVVFGHTHVPWRLEMDAGVLLNSGTCSKGQRMYASVDTMTGETAVHHLI